MITWSTGECMESQLSDSAQWSVMTWAGHTSGTHAHMAFKSSGTYHVINYDCTDKVCRVVRERGLNVHVIWSDRYCF